MRRFALILSITSLTAGCLTPTLRTPTAPVTAVSLPGRMEFRQGQIVYHSDAEVSPEHQLFTELASFPEHVSRTLGLPVTDKLVHVYLFRDRQTFEAYFRQEFQELPSRRALFVMGRHGLDRLEEARIYAFWGERVADDLRHELTHATLHAVLADVPLWLDEGLAMYFEPGAAAHGRHGRALDGIATEMNKGTWNPDLERLESLADVKQMHLADYHEAWAWVHLLLHGGPGQRTMLLAYLQDLRRGKADPLSARWQGGSESKLVEHLQVVIDERRHWPHSDPPK